MHLYEVNASNPLGTKGALAMRFGELCKEVWNTGPLAQYFNSGMHLYEVNASNPLGTKGALAMRFGELCKEVWTSGARSVAPLRVRWCVTRQARALAGGRNHDAQELLAWLLDALHEDLNRATPARMLNIKSRLINIVPLP